MVEGLALGTVEDQLGGALPPTGVAPGNEPSAGTHQHSGESIGSPDPTRDGGDAGFDPAGSPADRDDNPPSALDAVAGLVAAPDPQSFLGGLVGALSPLAGSGDGDVGTMLRLLGRALADALDEELAFQEIVDALDRRRLRSEGSVAVVAALLARIVSGSSSRTAPAEIAGLVRTAAQIVREALDSGRARSWHLLPQIAATLARRNAQRNLPIANLAAALPRLWAQMGPGPHDTSTAAPDQPWSGMTAQPRLMILNGPVEIVILGR